MQTNGLEGKADPSNDSEAGESNSIAKSARRSVRKRTPSSRLASTREEKDEELQGLSKRKFRRGDDERGRGIDRDGDVQMDSGGMECAVKLPGEDERGNQCSNERGTSTGTTGAATRASLIGTETLGWTPEGGNALGRSSGKTSAGTNTASATMSAGTSAAAATSATATSVTLGTSAGTTGTSSGMRATTTAAMRNSASSKINRHLSTEGSGMRLKGDSSSDESINEGGNQNNGSEESDGSDNDSHGDFLNEQETIVRAGEKEKLLRCLRSHNVELRASDVHGIGVFAMIDIPKGTYLFTFNGAPTSDTTDLSPQELSMLDEHVQGTVRKFFLPNSNGSFPIPTHGLSCALGLSFFMNSSDDTQHMANVEFGNKRDESGFTEIVTSRDIKKDEELLLPYSVENSMRGMSTIANGRDGLERRDPLPEDVLDSCRICMKDLPSGANPTDVVNIGCNCRNNSRMCRGCAQKWFLKRIIIQLAQQKPEHVRHDEVVNEWMPSVTATCEVCNHALSPSFCETLLKTSAASDHASPAISKLAKKLSSDNGKTEPVAVKISAVPGYKRVAVHTYGKSERTFSHYRHIAERHSYSQLGKRSREFQKRSSNKDLLEQSIWQPRLVAGRFEHKEAMFWMDNSKKWVRGRVHEYVCADNRNKCGCRQSVCICPKYERGMYRYTVDGTDVDEYFSDDDRTVKICGKSGKSLWRSP